MWPVPRVREFVLGESPMPCFRAQLFRNARIVLEEIQQPLGPGQVFVPNLLSPLIRRLWVLPTRAEKVGRHRAGAVNVGFAIGDFDDAEKITQAQRAFSALDVASSQFKARWAITRGLFDRQAVVGNFREA